MKKAPTLIVVRRREVQNNHDEMVEEEKEEEKEGDKEEEREEEKEEEKEEGEYVPFFKFVGEGAEREYQRTFRLRTFDCSANDFVREIADESENDEIVLPSLTRVAQMLFKEGKYSTSEVLYRRALEGYERVLGVDHPDTLFSVNNLGSLLKKQGKLEEAEVLYRRTLEGRERVLGVDHPSTLISVNNLGFLLYQQGKLDEAESLLRRTLEGYERVFGPEHSNTQNAAANLKIITGAVEQQ
jgi:tetratricopeptide (TPR) repeat protein